MSESGSNHLRYLQELEDVDLSLSSASLRQLSHVMGFDVAVPPTHEQIDRSQQWINSSKKRLFELALCQSIGIFGGRIATHIAKTGIERFDGQNGFVAIDVGFLGTGGPIVRPETKIRTMVAGAPQLRESPFEHTSFLAGKGRDDARVLPSRLASALRATALDELPQAVYQVPAGELVLLGARGYTQPELEGTRILTDLACNPRLDLSDRVKDFLDDYPKKVDEYKPVPAVSGLLQATTSKETPHLTRMYGDVVYWERSTPATDLRIAFFTFRQRVLRRVGAW